MDITKQATLQVYQLTAVGTTKVRAYLRPAPDASGNPAPGGQDMLEFDLGTEPAIGAEYTADTTYTPVTA